MPNIRYAFRQLRKSPAYTATALLTLALGIGGTTAIFTLIDAVMLRSLPVADPASLYRLGDSSDCCVEGGPQGSWGLYTWKLFERLRAAAPEFEELAAFQASNGRVNVRRAGPNSVPHPLRSEYVTGNYFRVFGINALGGRVFSPSDDVAGAPSTLVLSHHAWETQFAGDPAVVGSTLMVDGHAFTVIGVAPAGFFGETLRGDPPDMWIPLHQEPLLSTGGGLLNQPVSAWLRAIGRLKAGATVAGMEPRLTGVLHQWLLNESQYPANWLQELKPKINREVIHIVPAGGGVAEMKEEYGRSLRILLAVCGLVLLIACANVANLQLVRAVARRAQTALRLAIGASRRTIVVEALTESLVLSVLGGAAGLVIALGAARLLLALAFSTTRFLPIAVTPSLPVLAFAFGVSLLSGVIFGSAPAWMATRTDPAEAIRAQSRGHSGRPTPVSRLLIVLQAMLSVVLVAGATLLARSLENLQVQNFGYPTEGRVLVSLNRSPSDYPPEKLNALYRRMEARLAALPGVQSAHLAMYNPLTDNWGELIMIAGHAPGKLDESSSASWDRMSPDYLKNLGVPVIRGRHFADSDDENSAPVAVVNQAFVKRFFRADEDPVGKYFGLDLPELAETYRIVGIVGDARFAGWGFDRPIRPMFYVPAMQWVKYENPQMKRLEGASHGMSGALLMTNTPPGTLEPLIVRALAEVDAGITVTRVRTLRDQVALSFDRERAVATLAGLFGAVALLLAAVGVYGVTAYSVVRRTAEVGIRMALGANQRDVLGMILRGAATPVLMGLALGIPMAMGAGRLISTELYGVKFWDPAALMLAAGTLTLFALVGAFIPAARTTSISPTTALRAE